MLNSIAKKIIHRLITVSWRLGLILLILVPVLYASLYSLAVSCGAIGRLSTGWTLVHWHNAIADGFLLRTALHSIYIAASVTCIVIGLALCIAGLLPELRHSRWLWMMLLVQSGTPAVVVAAQTNHWVGGGGLLSRLAFHAGFIQSPNDFPATVHDSWSIGILFSISLTLLPLALLFFLNLWDSVGFDRFCRLAEQLGCTPWQAKFKVALPMMIKRASPLLVLIFLLALGSYEIPLLLDRQSPQMFAVATQQRKDSFNLSNRPQAFVLTTIYFVACSGLLFLHFRLRRVGDER